MGKLFDKQRPLLNRQQVTRVDSWPIKTIPTKRLNLSDIPEPTADWETIGRFALTFDYREAVQYWKRPPDRRELSVSSSLVDLRYYIYFENRRWNHFGR